MANILVLDDDPLMLSSLVDALVTAEYRVAPAASSAEALAAAESQAFDLIVADVRMSGMDGLDCVQQLKACQPRLKSIIITGYADDDAPLRAMDAATCDYLRKPFTTEQLLQSVSRALAAQDDNLRYRRLVEKAPSLKAASLDAMETSRGVAFRWFYVGIRAGHLRAVTARSVWDVVDAIERDKIQAEKSQSLASKALELKDRYDKVGIYCKVPTTLASSEGGSKAGLSQIRFMPLFKNVLDGLISCEQLKLAVYLRMQPAAESAEAPDLLELKRLIWGE